MTTTVRQLAVLGGEPAFDEVLHVGRPNIGSHQRIHERLDDILERRWLTNDGPVVQEFERRVGEFIGVQHCVAMCNATVALEIVIRAAGLTGEVIVPSYTFIATAHALQWQAITPVFCEIDQSHTIDCARVEALITPRTTGVLATHVWGQPCDVDSLSKICERHGLQLLFDAAHAFGCTRNGKAIGRFGVAEVLSFHATKFLNSFEGGMVVTNDGELAQRMRYMRNFGFGGTDRVDYVGTNGKMTEICAAMGLTNLECLNEFIDHNRSNYQMYRRLLAELPDVKLRVVDESEASNYQYIVMEVVPDSRLRRDELVAVLLAERVFARRYFWPGCHRMEPYKTLFPDYHLPRTDEISSRVIVLPTGTAVGEAEISTICEVIRSALDHASLVRTHLAR